MLIVRIAINVSVSNRKRMTFSFRCDAEQENFQPPTVLESILILRCRNEDPQGAAIARRVGYKDLPNAVKNRSNCIAFRGI